MITTQPLHRRILSKQVAVLLIALLLLTSASWLGVTAVQQWRNAEVGATDPPQERNYTLYVREGYVTMPDGAKVWVYGYTDNPNGQAQVPAPTLYANVGDRVNVRLVNDMDPTKAGKALLGDGHTIHIHGMDIDSNNDGDWMTNPASQPVEPGFGFTYSFTATQAGTYWYHCHQEALEHTQMGMYGAFIIKPRGGGRQAYENGPTFDKEYTIVLSGMDSRMHQSIYNYYYNNAPYPNWENYNANYFLMNGKSSPATFADAQTAINVNLGQKVLVRLINANSGGDEMFGIHLHGFHFQVIATDGRLLPQPYAKDTIMIGPGERYDILFTANQPGVYALQSSFHRQLGTNGISNGGMMTMVLVADANGNVPNAPHNATTKQETLTELADAQSILDQLIAAAQAQNWDEVSKQFKYIKVRIEDNEVSVRNFFRNDYKFLEADLDALEKEVGTTKLFPTSDSAAKVVAAATRLKADMARVGQQSSGD